MRDDSPQMQPVWCSFDGTHILVNTAKGRWLGVCGGDVRVLCKTVPRRVATMESTMLDFRASP
jgi:hypothetical protein